MDPICNSPEVHLKYLNSNIKFLFRMKMPIAIVRNISFWKPNKTKVLEVMMMTPKELKANSKNGCDNCKINGHKQRDRNSLRDRDTTSERETTIPGECYAQIRRVRQIKCEQVHLQGH